MLFFCSLLCQIGVVRKPEPDTPARPQSHSGGLWGVWLAGFLLMLYVLSVAPVMKLTKGKPSAALHTIYAPLEFAYDNISGVEKFYGWYFKLWGLDP